MPSLAPAHRGYLYQDIATAYFLARGLVDPVRATTIDWKFHPDDRFDDLLVAQADGRRVRRQFKYSETKVVFSRSFLNSERYDLRLDRLIRSWRRDPPQARAHEYRICVTWHTPTEPDDFALLVPLAEAGSFAGASRSFRLAIDNIWPRRGPPLLSCLRGTSRRDFTAFAARLVFELDCPPASRELEHPGTMERLLIDFLGDRVGFGRVPNEKPSPIDAAGRLIVIASGARSADAAGSMLTPIRVAGLLGLITDYGKIPQQFPFREELFVPVPELRRRLLQRINAGGITVLQGGPGAGKSWELTALIRRLRSRGDVVAAHYCYLAPGDPRVQSRITLNTFYGNVMAAIVEAVPGLRDANSARYAAGAKELQGLLNEAVRLKPDRRVVVIVDGLDHVARVLRDAPTISAAETHIAQDLLALNLPRSVSVIVGSQPGDHIAQLAQAGTVLTVPPWDEAAVHAFVRRTRLDPRLQQLHIRRDSRQALVTELTTRSRGNALYCTYLCRELEQHLAADVAADPLTVLDALPASNGALATYYEYLLGRLDHSEAMVAEALGLIDFGVTPAELGEIFPVLQGWVDAFLRKIEPILEQTRGRGGLRIYHESFRRYILDQARRQPGRLAPKLQAIIAWLDSRGFMADARAYRFLLPNLVRAERASEVLARIGRDFVVESVAAGHSSAAINANLTLFATVAADAQDFPMLTRGVELARSLSTCDSNLDDILDYGTTFAAIFGVDRLVERLTFDGAPTMKIADGLKLCSYCADAGASPPWYAYLDKPLPAHEDQNIAAEMARLHGRLAAGGGAKLRQRIVKWLKQDQAKVDRRYLENVVRRWREYAGAEDLQRLRRESRCSGEIAAVLDLEFARSTGDAKRRQAAATRAGRVTTDAARAIEALRLGAAPAKLAHLANRLDQHEIGLNTGIISAPEHIERWLSGVRTAAFVQPRLLAAERIRIRGPGWYRLWLAFAITLAEIERRALRRPEDAADDVVDALRELASDVHPFLGSPRACDLFHAENAIADSLRRALTLLQSPQQWRQALRFLKTISRGTTTRLDNSQGGPLTPSTLFALVAPFAQRADLRDLIRREIEQLLERQHSSNIYHSIAADEMSFASLLVTLGDRAGAEAHWKSACLHLCAYGMRKDITIYEVLDNVSDLGRAGKPAVLGRLARLLPLTYAVVSHTDGRETSHSVSKWFRKLTAIDEIGAAWLLGRSMARDAGRLDYRLEESLGHWVDNADEMGEHWRQRLELVTEGPSDAEKVRRRIARLEALHAADSAVATMELQLLAAAVHGDPIALPSEAFGLLRDFAGAHGSALPTGQPDVTYPERTENNLQLPPEPVRPPLGWPAPASPAAMLRQMRDALRDHQISNQQLLDYCRPPFAAWAGTHRAELDEILIFIARHSDYPERGGLLAGLGADLEAAGHSELAARTLALAYAVHRGEGGWLSFGGDEHEGLLRRALAAARPVALATMAHEFSHRLGAWGLTRHFVRFLGRHDDINLAVSLWDEACTMIAYRLPGYADAQGPFLALESAQIPAWSREDAAMFLILARISHPEKRRKTAALSQAAWLIQQERERCAAAFRGILQTSTGFTHQLWVLQLLAQFEDAPFGLSQALAPELNGLVASGRVGTELLAQQLLRRAGLPITGTVVRNSPIITVTPTSQERRAVLSLDMGEAITKIEELWPEFGDLVVGRFETIVRSDENHKQRMKDRGECRTSRVHRTYPTARFHGWEDELFQDALHEVATGIERYLWSCGDWNDGVWPRLLSWLLPDLEMPTRHTFSRRVRPSWPLPGSLTEGVGPVLTVPDGELSGWIRLGFFETHLDTGGSSLNEIRTKTEVLAGVVLDETAAPPPDSGLPFTYPNKAAWLRPFAPTMPLAQFAGPCASFDAFGRCFAFHQLVGVSPRLLASLELRPRSKVGPLDLFDQENQLAVAYRWWSSRPLGDHDFPDENPRVFGGALLMHPDLFCQITAATGLQAFECLSIKVEYPERELRNE